MKRLTVSLAVLVLLCGCDPTYKDSTTKAEIGHRVKVVADGRIGTVKLLDANNSRVFVMFGDTIDKVFVERFAGTDLVRVEEPTANESTVSKPPNNQDKARIKELETQLKSLQTAINQLKANQTKAQPLAPVTLTPVTPEPKHHQPKRAWD